jgi:hypothetical protein
MLHLINALSASSLIVADYIQVARNAWIARTAPAF